MQISASEKPFVFKGRRKGRQIFPSFSKDFQTFYLTRLSNFNALRPKTPAERVFSSPSSSNPTPPACLAAPRRSLPHVNNAPARSAMAADDRTASLFVSQIHLFRKIYFASRRSRAMNVDAYQYLTWERLRRERRAT